MEKEKKKRIVFYSASPPSIMIYKIARLFYKKGYETILITMCEKEVLNFDFYKDAFNEIICSNFQFFKPSKKTLFYLLKRGASFIKFLIKTKILKPYVVIGTSGANWQLKFVHKYFFKKYPFIYFPYDIISSLFNSKEEAIKKGIKTFELEAEKYCLENSDGILHKGSPNELEFFKNKYSLSKLQLDFSTYSSKEFSVPLNKNKVSKRDGEVHIVYIGFLFNDEESVRIMTERFNEILSQKLHLHVYAQVNHIPRNQADIYFKDLFSRFSKSKYFHIHPPLGSKEIIKEISKYDYSLWMVNTYDLNLPWNKYSIGNKFASYFEAGVPMIYCKESGYVVNLMKKYKLEKLGFNRNLKGLRKRLKRLNYKEIERKIIDAREDFDMDKNFPRLERFIGEVVASKKI
ncbi:MAG: hypothetical protein AABX54_05160 [Nanoarchaeota archaeon]